MPFQRQNADIARDRLRLDLFEQRYEVFKASRTIIEIFSTYGFSVENPRQEEAVVALRKVGEATFTCGEKGRSFCARLESWYYDREIVMMMLQTPANTSGADNVGELVKASHTSLMQLGKDINQAFESELRIKRPY